MLFHWLHLKILALRLNLQDTIFPYNIDGVEERSSMTSEQPTPKLINFPTANGGICPISTHDIDYMRKGLLNVCLTDDLFRWIGKERNFEVYGG
jgi:hypothetical protein